MTLFLLVAGVIAMVIASGFLAAAETAIGSLSRADLEELAQDARQARSIRAIAAAPEPHSNALSFTRVLLETMAAVLVTLILIALLPESWQVFAVAVGIMMLVSFLLTGASPRSVGRAHPRAVLAAGAWAVRAVRVVLGPFAELLVAVGDRVTPGRPSRAGSVTSEQQLLSMVDEAAELDVLEDDDRELIHSVLDFSGRIVREVMVARTDMITVDEDESTLQAEERLLVEGISRAPVVGRDADDVRGVLFLKDVVAHRLHGGPQRGVAELARPATFVPESLPAANLLRQMQRESSHFAIVVDEYGGVAGLVTLEDLIEELVGEISDEFDRGAEAVEELGAGAYRLSSRTPTTVLGDLFDREVEDDDVDSVGGLIAKALGKIPASGDVAVVDGLRLRAERVGRRGRVATVIVTAEQPPAPPEPREPGWAEVDAVLAERARAARQEHAGRVEEQS